VSLQSTDVWKLDDFAQLRWLQGAMPRRIHIERKMRSPAVVIIEVARERSFQMSFVQHDDFI
jgi:hypothetical protein